MATIQELREVRINKLNKLIEMGFNPYPPYANKTVINSRLTQNFEKYENSVQTLTGRLMSWREHGPLSFGDLQDESGRIQLYIKQDSLAEKNVEEQLLGYEDLNLLDIGDFLEVTGKVTKTQRGEISLEATHLKIIAKALRPLPEKWDGLKDVEERYRKRYLDLLTTPETRRVLDARWKITWELRKFLIEKGFNEVETPILQSLYGGTNAKPFTTHFNALDCDFYLRVAPELYLKRLIVGGYEKVFEIARNFRNEGMDHSHFPEFTMVEWYEAYADYNKVMDLAEELAKHLIRQLSGKTELSVGENTIEIGNTWRRVPVEELLKEHLGIEWNTVSETELKELQEKYKVKTRGVWTKNKALFAIFDHVITKKLIEPTWVIDYPIEVSPLAKAHRSKPGRTERFEGYIGGVEIFDGWSEIVSGLEQRQRFETEQNNMREGDDEAMPLDEDFIEALEHGAPPMGGIGFGVDRLVMFLTNTWAIKDVTAFPILKPRNN
ncbi:lysine--tRNA ligase [candidate division WWE3 bacterium RIFOXYC1_FULL_40_10]|uniref:Lysine--tRNA ligase n=1 Tax=candidate division WWE3 bacterium RIFOXYA2_FULL_46_9 TaxID=1802636 RepID=A0A1F4VYQ4_UNCKA|nr:MAG: lysine--tRNA ligase [candidate division WWE3 bacterium RIFOXYB1_FULL_40_22]OGC61928.1 MAG: lysine--tRNA ligase [candidate division WWE3 bacterium RIFOXYA1_FULL_40_11]OGC62294.1 MAG: lysine--tRNA ligase [candidate division WWE3 bacterium RIFOXYA2_FULL_46_9]OGC66311.1 MAG: lysine--tRNA ligase [candidate division WWE3 bacterium RIFOXYC1_FULL_40_10]OGC67913.1 MAG: lysine--tRNA ligase [candidate division WWE3 bacterium RIFOXYC2_FULL_40_11]OGC70674.1 MAG: lysine--tRNA ligase [candidate divis